MIPRVGFVADAQPGNGLGHISRCSAVALALRCKGFEIRGYALGSVGAIERDGVDWEPLTNDGAVAGDLVVLDSYVMSEEQQVSLADGRKIVVMHEGSSVDHAALAVNTTLPKSDDPRHLYGLAYAALRPPFWGVVRAKPPEEVRSILITMGASDASGLSARIARLAKGTIPRATVRVVRGPRATFEVPAETEVIDAPSDLLHHFLAADVAICSGGQTSLEAAATGTPSITLSLAENQAPNTRLLQELGVTTAIDPDDEEGLATALLHLVHDPTRRRQASERARACVDGYGAFRVAFRIGELLS